MLDFCQIVSGTPTPVPPKSTNNSGSDLYEPKQQRSREKYERVIQASYALAAEVGFEGITLAKIAKRAGIAPSTVYTRFKDKEALLHALHKQATDKSLEEIEMTFEKLTRDQLSLHEILEATITRSLQLTDEIAGFQKACYQRALSDPVFAARESAVRKELNKKFKRLFKERRAEIGHDNINLCAQFFVAMYTSIITEHFMTREFPVESMSNQQLARELIDACVAYLQLKV